MSKIPTRDGAPAPRQSDRRGNCVMAASAKAGTPKGTHFRRQVPIGPYVTDFACMASRLVIELDGSQHGDENRQSARQVAHAMA